MPESAKTGSSKRVDAFASAAALDRRGWSACSRRWPVATRRPSNASTTRPPRSSSASACACWPTATMPRTSCRTSTPRWRKAAQYDAAIASPISWLAMIAHNKAIDRLRSDGAARNAVPIELAGHQRHRPRCGRARRTRRRCAPLDQCLQRLEAHGAARSSAPPSSMARRTKNSRDAPIRPSAR